MIKVVGIGSGSLAYLLPIAKQAILQAEVIVGYHYYFDFIQSLIAENTLCIGKELSEEALRADIAIAHALKGQKVVVLGSGDASIYGMAAIVYEKIAQQNLDIAVETLPGISALLTAGAKLGAVLGHDFCAISLSDLMTPWETIEKRIQAAAMGDFVTGIYNPKSKTRYWQLTELQKIFLKHRKGNTPVAICRQLTRKEEKVTIITLADLDVNQVDMFCLVVIGNSQTFRYKNHLITPRGYLNRKPHTGEEIQKASFEHILAQLPAHDFKEDALWAAVRCVHTAGDIGYFDDFYATEHAIAQWHEYLVGGGAVVCDVTMVASGITKTFSEPYQNKIHCFLNDEETKELSVVAKLTRSQAGIRRAIAAHPKALFVIGNAPTALIEICNQIQQGTCHPVGIIAAPVGFVNVLASKSQVACLPKTPYAMIKGNRGGSNFAATIVNAAFSYQKGWLKKQT